MGFRARGRQAGAALAVAASLSALTVIASGYMPNLTASPVGAITDGVDGFTMLDGAGGIAIAEISGGTYALVAAWQDNGVQIVNITNPASPTPVAELIVGMDGFGETSVPQCEALPSCHMMTAGINGSGELSRCSCTIYFIHDDSIAIAEISGGTYAFVLTGSEYGVQIVNITNPAAPVPMAWATDDTGHFAPLYRPHDIAITVISGGTYALVAPGWGGIQIINVTNPAAPVTVIGLTEGIDGLIELDESGEAAATAISGETHTLVYVSSRDEGIQIIDITNPAAPVPVAGSTKDTGGFAYLSKFRGITTTEISGKIYALIPTSGRDGGIQIIDITNPAAPVPVAWVTDGVDGFTELDETHDIAITKISGRTYALVLVFEYSEPWMPFGGLPPRSDPSPPDHGVQIIDVTNPAIPVPVAWVTDGVDGFTELYWVNSIAIAEISGRTYALITASIDDGVQIIELARP